MIKSDAQRDRTLAQIEGFRRALAKAEEENPGKRSAAIRGSYEGMIRQLEDELHEYDQVKSGELTLPHVERLDQIAPFIAKVRIAEGVSQTELARRLGVSKQVISRSAGMRRATIRRSRLFDSRKSWMRLGSRQWLPSARNGKRRRYPDGRRDQEGGIWSARQKQPGDLRTADFPRSSS